MNPKKYTLCFVEVIVCDGWMSNQMISKQYASVIDAVEYARILLLDDNEFCLDEDDEEFLKKATVQELYNKIRSRNYTHRCDADVNAVHLIITDSDNIKLINKITDSDNIKLINKSIMIDNKICNDEIDKNNNYPYLFLTKKIQTFQKP